MIRLTRFLVSAPNDTGTASGAVLPSVAARRASWMSDMASNILKANVGTSGVSRRS
jgi:hypothetical protein